MADRQHRSEQGRGGVRRRDIRDVVVVLLLTVGVWSAVLGWIAARRLAGDPRGFILAGLRYYHGEAFDDVAMFGPRGYDGEFYAALATDPLILKADTTWGLDSPGYRARRIGVPLVAWLAAVGRPRAAVYSYQLVCWLAVVLVAPLLALWLLRAGMAPWWALLAVPSAGLVASVLRTTPDGAAAALAVVALLAWREERRGVSVAAAALAVLVRETSLILCAGLALAAWRAGRRRMAVAFVGVPALLVGSWYARLVLVFGREVFAGSQNLAVPFSWLSGKIAQLGALPLTSAEWAGTLAIVMCIVALAAAVGSRTRAASWVLAGFCAMALVLGWRVYVDIWAYARVLCVIPVLALAAAAEEAGVRRSLLVAVTAAWAVAGMLLLISSLGAAAAVTVPARIAAGYGVKGAAFPNGLPPEPPAPGAGDGPVAYAFPVAHDSAGPSRWRTDLAIRNPGPTVASVVFEVLKGSDLNYPWPCRLRLEPGQELLVADALARLFAWTGRVGLRMTFERGSPDVRFRTYDSRQSDRGEWRSPLSAPEGDGVAVPAESVVSTDAVGGPSAGRSLAIALLNPSGGTCTVSLLGDPGTARCRSVARAEIGPWRFAEFDEPFGTGRPVPGSFSVSTPCRGVLVGVVAGGTAGQARRFLYPAVTRQSCAAIESDRP
ncbi:MAG: hypothetical protein ACM3O7_10970 [Acidobacteriota bacterium]